MQQYLVVSIVMALDTLNVNVPINVFIAQQEIDVASAVDNWAMFRVSVGCRETTWGHHRWGHRRPLQ